MNVSEIRGKDSRELRLDMQALRKEVFELRFRGSAEELSNPSRFKQIRRTIARIHTVLRERELAAAKESAAHQSSDQPSS
jgi:large subunit ribosomal protein L29